MFAPAARNVLFPGIFYSEHKRSRRVFSRLATFEKYYFPKTVDENNFNVAASIVTKDESDEILHIIYFDFDKFSLTKISLEEIKNFLKKYNNNIKKY